MGVPKAQPKAGGPPWDVLCLVGRWWAEEKPLFEEPRRGQRRQPSGPTIYKTVRKELLVLILGQPPRDRQCCVGSPWLPDQYRFYKTPEPHDPPTCRRGR